jgi:hypothetical protein
MDPWASERPSPEERARQRDQRQRAPVQDMLRHWDRLDARNQRNRIPQGNGKVKS